MPKKARLRSVVDDRPPIRTHADALKAIYGTADLYRVVGLTRGQLQSWLAEGLIAPIEESGGLRIYNFAGVLIAAVCKAITDLDPRIPLGRLKDNIAQEWESKINSVDDVLDRPDEDPLVLVIELKGSRTIADDGRLHIRNPRIHPSNERKFGSVNLRLTVNLTEIFLDVLERIVQPDVVNNITGANDH